jgi:hypothetical protein
MSSGIWSSGSRPSSRTLVGRLSRLARRWTRIRRAHGPRSTRRCRGCSSTQQRARPRSRIRMPVPSSRRGDRHPLHGRTCSSTPGTWPGRPGSTRPLTRRAQQILGAFDPAPSEVTDRCLAVGGLQAADEVVLRHPGEAGEPVEVEVLGEVGVDVVSGAAEVGQQLSCDRAGRGASHPPNVRADCAHRFGCQRPSSAPSGVVTTLRQPTGPSRGSSRIVAPYRSAAPVARRISGTSTYGSHPGGSAAASTTPMSSLAPDSSVT